MSSGRRCGVITAKQRKIRSPPTTNPVGKCVSCDELFYGPEAVRLQQGGIKQHRWGTQFIKEEFEDNTPVKWVCVGCSVEGSILTDGYFEFTDMLRDLSEDGQCILCRRVIEPLPSPLFSTAILIERGLVKPSSKGSFALFEAVHGGHLHYSCMDDLSLPLWNIIYRNTDL